MSFFLVLNDLHYETEKKIEFLHCCVFADFFVIKIA
jgi:hypothetical protein